MLDVTLLGTEDLDMDTLLNVDYLIGDFQLCYHDRHGITLEWSEAPRNTLKFERRWTTITKRKACEIVGHVGALSVVSAYVSELRKTAPGVIYSGEAPRWSP